MAPATEALACGVFAGPVGGQDLLPEKLGPGHVCNGNASNIADRVPI